jgi:hypothetical protein
LLIAKRGIKRIKRIPDRCAASIVSRRSSRAEPGAGELSQFAPGGGFIAGRPKIDSPVGVLKIATLGNCALFAISGWGDPRATKLSVLRPGAWAEMLLIDGDPTKDIGVLKDYEKEFVVIVRDRRGA